MKAKNSQIMVVLRTHRPSDDLFCTEVKLNKILPLRKQKKKLLSSSSAAQFPFLNKCNSWVMIIHTRLHIKTAETKLHVPVFHFTASLQVVSLFLLKAKLLLLPPQFLALTSHALRFLPPFLKKNKYKFKQLKIWLRLQHYVRFDLGFKDVIKPLPSSSAHSCLNRLAPFIP